MTIRRLKFEAGLTLIEIAISTVILLIIILGASTFRYNAALCARKADLRVTAERIALLLCESWHAANDANDFDPTQLTNTPDSKLSIESSMDGYAAPENFTTLGSYVVVADDVKYYATLSWKYSSGGSGLRILNVAVGWQQRGSDTSGFEDVDKSFRLTTCAEN